MRHEVFLMVSYVAGFVLCLALSVGTYLWLRGSFRALLVEVPEPVRRRTLGRFFPWNVIIPGVVAFLTVSYYGSCGRSYEMIVTDREWMIDRNTHQLQRTAEWLIVALFFWGVITAMALVARERALRLARKHQDPISNPPAKA